VRTVGPLSIIIASTLVGLCGANSAPFSSQNSGQVWSLQTPFGIVYGTIPREVVDYPTARVGGTIVVSTSQRRLYYVVGGGKAIRYGIAVGMEGYAWSVSVQLVPNANGRTGRPRQVNCSGFRICLATWLGVQIIR